MLTEKHIEYLREQKAQALQKGASGLLTEALVSALKAMIDQGEFARTQRLPPSRVLAASIQVSRGTVERCYSALESEGYVHREVGRGSFISPRERPLLGKRSVLQPTLDNAFFSNTALSRRSTNGAQIAFDSVPYQRPFTPGVPETRNFPMHIWLKLYQQVAKEEGALAIGGSRVKGSEALCGVISDYLRAERGVRASAEQVIIVSSTQQALSLCAQVLADADDTVYMENPGYPGAIRAFRAAQLNVQPISVDDSGIDVESISRSAVRAKAIYLTPSNQYPTGSILSLQRRLALIAQAKQRGMWIIEDDYDSEFHYSGVATTSLQGLDGYQRTIYLGTFSKTLLPALGVAYMVVPEPLVEPMVAMRRAMDGAVSPLTQLTLARFMQQGHFREYVRIMRKMYATRVERFIQLLKQYVGDKATIIYPECGLQVLCLVENKAIERFVIAQSIASGIALQGLSDLCCGDDALSGWVMGFAAFDPIEAERYVKQFADILHQYDEYDGK
ncbi:HTH-type transcriptional regulatory protein gabR [Leminorella richardii]|uniref:HTH-type transcriptional regulatory protein gabR n=1 Tax=Leminorella richardii TaxID=158841 RepID=A0A2X4U9X4_9GAMM|nr:PLP-dependent aminotransferase family protein [Leminorella richardii]SQI36586.1 HTH-type transcriptional regulatory protein gabR [Leminorella richardii]